MIIKIKVYHFARKTHGARNSDANQIVIGFIGAVAAAAAFAVVVAAAAAVRSYCYYLPISNVLKERHSWLRRWTMK